MHYLFIYNLLNICLKESSISSFCKVSYLICVFRNVGEKFETKKQKRYSSVSIPFIASTFPKKLPEYFEYLHPILVSNLVSGHLEIWFLGLFIQLQIIWLCDGQSCQDFDCLTSIVCDSSKSFQRVCCAHLFLKPKSYWVL